jgi:anti-anti-sigma regulatory factor
MRAEDCHKLDQFIRDAPNQPIVIDGQNVEKFSGLGAQLIAAHQSYRSDEHLLTVSNPSAALSNALEILGLAQILNTGRGRT